MNSAKTISHKTDNLRQNFSPRLNPDVDNRIFPENKPTTINAKIDEVMKSFHQEKVRLANDFSVKSIEYCKNNSGFFKRFMNDANYRSASISGANAFLHSLTVATSFTPGLKKINEFVDKSAFFFTKIVSPFISFGVSAFFALLDKKPIEALIKAVPPIFLPFIGDANVDTVFGLCFGFNQPYDIVSDRIKAKIKESPDFAADVKEKNQTYAGNTKLVLSEFKHYIQDFFAGKLPWRDAGYVINCSMMLLGSIPMMLFASQQRNTSIAKFFGILRNFGGVMGDALFLSQKANFHKLLVGILCSLGAMSNITKRLVHNDALARVFIHLGAALDVAGYTVWNAWSDKKD